MPRKRGPGRPPKKGRKKIKGAKQNNLGFVFDEKMNPETFWGIVIVLSFLAAVITFLSLFNIAGSLGEVFKRGVRIVFGYDAYLLPFIFGYIGYILLKRQREEKYQLKKATFFGFVLFFTSIAGFFHSLSRPEEYLSVAKTGMGGGYLGYLVMFPLERVIGTWASFVVLLAFLVMGVILIFNTSPGKLVEIAGQFRHYLIRLIDKITKRKAIREAGLRVKGLKNNENAEEEVEQVIDQVIDQEDMAVLKEKESGMPDLSFNDEKIEKKGSNASLDVKVSKPSDGYKPFSLDLLDGRHGKPTSGDIRANARIIEDTLKSFDLEVKMEEVNIGPTVTQYTFRPKSGVKLSQITTLQNDLSLALAAHPLRIEAPIPGKSLVGVEIPNRKVALVRLCEVLKSKEFKSLGTGLFMALGRNVAGDAIVINIAKMPHLLIAGATGSGKSVSIHSLILSLIYNNSPTDLKMILVDPKKVELTCYNGIPHLLTKVITDVEKTINSLKWSVAEMERRFLLLSESGRRDIESYNKAYPKQRLPYIVMIIDELADLMAVAAGDVEAAVVRLAQMSRAVGIHLVLATQRPSVNVITGLIKANITARIAFTVASQIDSRTIIDSSGAEKLLGNGDMLYVASELGKPRRVQGSFVGENEVKKVVNYLKSLGEAKYNEEVVSRQTIAAGTPGYLGNEDQDELFEDAKEVIAQAGKASASLLQRRLKVGYARAARLLDSLEEQGVIGPQDGAKPREVYLESTKSIREESTF